MMVIDKMALHLILLDLSLACQLELGAELLKFDDVDPLQKSGSKCYPENINVIT